MSANTARRRDQTVLRSQIAQLNDHFCVQLQRAYRLYKRRANARSTLRFGAHLDDVTQASLSPSEPCSLDRCTASRLPLRVYRYVATSDQEFSLLHQQQGMFISPQAVELAFQTELLASDASPMRARTMLHVCAQFCAGYDRQHVDALHQDEIVSERLTTVLFCNYHLRFHICDDLCQYQASTSRMTTVCALSRNLAHNSAEQGDFSFGDGTGARKTSEQQEQTDSVGGTSGDGGERKRKRSASTRVNIRNSAPQGPQLTPEEIAARRREQRSISAAKRKKASKLRGGSSANKPALAQRNEAPLVVRLLPDDVERFRQRTGDALTLGDTVLKLEATQVTLRLTAPFDCRTPGLYEREFALDELHKLRNRERLKKRFALGHSAEQNTFFTDAILLTDYLVDAYEIVECMLFGEQCATIMQAAHERSHAAARKAVTQALASAQREQRVVVLSELDQIYVEALTSTHNYVRVVIDSALREAALSVYALQIVEFYFSLLALEIVVPPADVHAPYATVRRDTKFVHLVPVIADMMHGGAEYRINNVCVLPRDTFLLSHACPDSGVLRDMGLHEHMANTLKKLLKQLLDMAREQGAPARLMEATEVSWTNVCLASAEANCDGDKAGDAAVRLFLDARAKRLAAMSRVVYPADNPHPDVKQ